MANANSSQHGQTAACPLISDTPAGRVALEAPGSYHIDAFHPDGDRPAARFQVTVLDGRAEASRPRSRVEIMAGESAAIGGQPAGQRSSLTRVVRPPGPVTSSQIAPPATIAEPTPGPFVMNRR